jgi:DNA-binding transcriptional ArsR family regulator
MTRSDSDVKPGSTHPPERSGDYNDDLRELRDPRDMRALAHPTRLAILEALTLHGPLTATQAGELVGESASSCSFHLRSLARHGFVEETGDGRGRERPWRRIAMGTRMSAPYDSVAAEVAANALSDVFLDRFLARLREARRRRDELDPEWAKVQSDIESVLWLTPTELEKISETIVELAMSYRRRIDDPETRPEGSRPVELLYFAYSADIVSLKPETRAAVKAAGGPAARRGRGRTPRGSRPER